MSFDFSLDVDEIKIRSLLDEEYHFCVFYFLINLNDFDVNYEVTIYFSLDIFYMRILVIRLMFNIFLFFRPSSYLRFYVALFY